MKLLQKGYLLLSQHDAAMWTQNHIANSQNAYSIEKAQNALKRPLGGDKRHGGD